MESYKLHCNKTSLHSYMPIWEILYNYSDHSHINNDGYLEREGTRERYARKTRTRMKLVCEVVGRVRMRQPSLLQNATEQKPRTDDYWSLVHKVGPLILF